MQKFLSILAILMSCILIAANLFQRKNLKELEEKTIEAFKIICNKLSKIEGEI